MYKSWIHLLSEKDNSFGAIRITGPYFSWARATTELRLPEPSLIVSHLVVIFARKGPGTFRSGEKKKL